MTVGVVIATYADRQAWLNEAVASISAQTVKPKEILISYQQEGEGFMDIARRLNDLIRKLDCDYYIMLGDDDKLEPNFIETVIRVAEKEQADIVTVPLTNFGSASGLHVPGYFPFFTSLVKKSIWEKVGGIDSTIGQIADVDFWWMCMDAGARIARTADTFYWYRNHPGQDSKNTKAMQESRVRVLKKHNTNKYPHE